MKGAAIAFGIGLALAGTAAAAESIGGGVELTIAGHASFVLEWRGVTIYVDPSRIDGLAGVPPPDLVLVTAGNLDHLDVDKLRRIVTSETLILAPATVAERRIRSSLGFVLGCSGAPQAGAFDCPPAGWEDRGMAPGESTTFRGIRIDAFPAATADTGCCLSYLVTLGSTRVFIGGALRTMPTLPAGARPAAAFLPVNQRSGFGPDAAAAAVATSRPRAVYPYLDSPAADIATFTDLAGPSTEVRLRDWGR